MPNIEIFKNFERIEINYLNHDGRLTFRLYKTIAKLAETVGDDSSLARTRLFLQVVGWHPRCQWHSDERDSHRLRNSWQEDRREIRKRGCPRSTRKKFVAPRMKTRS